MRVLEFIKNNVDWQKQLRCPPYNISIKEDDKYYLLKYNQIESDFSEAIVCECRGLILRKSDMTVASRAFDKFFNAAEPRAAQIDWESATVQEKLDGSIIKVWYDADCWHISTSGNIDAYNAKLDNDLSPVNTFGKLFDLALKNLLSNKSPAIFWDKLSIEYTYIFEMCSPYNKVVVNYQHPTLYLIGIRNNNTFVELNPDESELSKLLPRPKRYPLASLADCLAATQKMSYNEEGFVVVDKNYNRVKIKSPAFVAAFYLKNNNVQTLSRLLKLILLGEQSEFLGYFPEFTNEIKRIEKAYCELINTLDDQTQKAAAISFDSRKDYAIWANKECICPDYMFFALNTGFTKEPAEWFKNLSEEKQETLIKKQMNEM